MSSPRKIFESIETSDPDELVEAVGRRLGPAKLDMLGRNAKLQCRIRFVPFGDVGIVHGHYISGFKITFPEFESLHWQSGPSQGRRRAPERRSRGPSQERRGDRRVTRSPYPSLWPEFRAPERGNSSPVAHGKAGGAPGWRVAGRPFALSPSRQRKRSSCAAPGSIDPLRGGRD
jgi:hypothetical protein